MSRNIFKTDSLTYNSSSEKSHYGLGDSILTGLMMVSYLMGWAVSLSAVVEKNLAAEPPTNAYLYIIFFIIPHILAGTKNLHYWWKEELSKEEDEQSNLSILLHLLFFPMSPLLRLFNSLRYGGSSNDDFDDGRSFVEESSTAGVLMLFDAFLGDGAILTLLIRDDIWTNSVWGDVYGVDEKYQENTGVRVIVPCLETDSNDPLRPECAHQSLGQELYWPVARIVLLLCRISLTYTYYNMMIKRLQRIRYPEFYSSGLYSSSGKLGQANPFGWFLLFLGNFGFIASRSMGYALASGVITGWVYLIIGLRWLAHTVWGFVIYAHSGDIIPARSVSPLIMGGVWLFGLTNEYGGPQLGRYVVFYGGAFAETAVCGGYYAVNMLGSGDFFEVKGPWSVLAVFLAGILLNLLYYTVCHPGRPNFSTQGFLCCSGDRRDQSQFSQTQI